MGALLSWVRDGCSHVKVSFPITRGGRDPKASEPAVPKTYMVCLTCGKEIPYDWQQMRVQRN